MNDHSKPFEHGSKNVADVNSNEDEVFDEEYIDDYLNDGLLTEDDTSDDEGSVEILYLQFPEEIVSTNSPAKDITNNESNKKTVRENKVVPKSNGSTSNICRLCLKQGADCKDIFQETLENDIPIFVGIISCIQPLEISKGDNLPDKICKSCFMAVQNYFGFRKICLENDKVQRKQFKDNTGSFPLKRKKSLNHSKNKKKRTYESEHDTDSTFNDLPPLDIEYEENLIEFFEKEKVEIEEEKLVKIENLDKANVEVEISKGDKVEAKIREIIEGTLTEEQAQAENIIIHIQNDNEENETLTKLTELKLPIVIKPVTHKDSSFQSKNVIIDYEKDLNNTEENCFKGAVSDVGIFEATSCTFIPGFEFCIIDGYVFEFRLCKGKVRYLRCVLPTCPAKGVQDKIQDGLYSGNVSVEKAHNHARPNDKKRKKQMFFFVMKRKLHSDKGLNIRDVYEEIHAQDPEIRTLVPLKNVINEICKHQLTYKLPVIQSFSQFFDLIEEDNFQKLQFTQNGKQFYQEKFTSANNVQAIVFANKDIIDQVSDTQLMYVDASFRIDTNEDFKYHLVTVLVWMENSYYPIYYGLVSMKSIEIYKQILQYLHDTLAPKLRPKEIITDFESNLYYALGEVYVNSTIGGSVFYYTQNLYKKICSLNLSRDLETNVNFRNMYQMLLMLPLLPVNTILAGLNNIETQARDLGLSSLMRPIFDHVRNEWIINVTPNFFCVHKMENRINENVTAPFKKLRDYLMLAKGKAPNKTITITTVVEKLIELEYFLQVIYSAPSKKSFARDLSSTQKKNVLKAWQFIESHPKINLNNFFGRVVGYIRCMENQLWIWGFYRFSGDINDELINAANFSIAANEDDPGVPPGNREEPGSNSKEFLEHSEDDNESYGEYVQDEEGNEHIVIEAIIDENGVVQTKNKNSSSSGFNKSFLKYVQNEK